MPGSSRQLEEPHGRARVRPFAKRGPRNDKRRTANREALLEAAIAILNDEGPGAITPQLVTARAGLNRRVFYAQFQDVQACLEAVATRVTQSDLERSLARHREAMASIPTDEDKQRAALEQSLRDALSMASLYKLFARFRYEDSAVGRAIRQTVQSACDAWTELIWEYMRAYGVSAVHRKDVRLLAEHLIDHHLAACLRAVHGVEPDLADLAARVLRYNRAMVHTELRRMLGLAPIADAPEVRERRRRMTSR